MITYRLVRKETAELSRPGFSLKVHPEGLALDEKSIQFDLSLELIVSKMVEGGQDSSFMRTNRFTLTITRYRPSLQVIGTSGLGGKVLDRENQAFGIRGEAVVVFELDEAKGK